MRAIAIAAVLFLLAASASWGSATPASRAKTRWRATVATLPANAATGESQAVSITSISCASRGNCTAVGSYADNADHREGLLLTEKAGRWRRGVEAVLPPDAASNPYVTLTSVSCPSPGNCTAVGGYDSAPDAGRWGLLLTEKSGHWQAGVASTLPADAGPHPSVWLSSVSCATAGNCTAVGWDGGHGVGLLLTQKAGHWAQGVDYGDGAAGLRSVSCSSDGRCSAVGYEDYYVDHRDGPGAWGLLLTKKGGTWRQVPLDYGQFLASVSCAPGGNCSAIDSFSTSIDESQYVGDWLFNERAGKVGREVMAEAPKNANSPYWGHSVVLAGISCPSAGDCVAAGVYHSRKRKRVTLLTERAGRWHRGIEAALPGGATHPEPSAISCASPGNCTVVGSFGKPDIHGFLLTEIAGQWARGVRTPHFSGSLDYVSSVSCASPGNCGAVGVDWTRGGPSYGILLDSTTKR